MRAKTSFTVGDVVRLKSGGPRMTISKLEDAYGKYTAVWVKENGDPQTMCLEPDCFELAAL